MRAIANLDDACQTAARLAIQSSAPVPVFICPDGEWKVGASTEPWTALVFTVQPVWGPHPKPK